MTFENLYKIILNRKKNLPKDSYLSSLFLKGDDRIIQKVGEEAIEVLIAAKNKKRSKLISELADLWFHLLILMVKNKIRIGDILTELKNRNKQH